MHPGMFHSALRVFVAWSALTLCAFVYAPEAYSAEPWKTAAHTSASVNVLENEIRIQAPDNVHANAKRPFEAQRGPFRVSASFRGPKSGLWAPSVFLYWKADTWLRIGQIGAFDYYHVHGPGTYGVMCDGGKQALYRLTTTTAADWKYNPDGGDLVADPGTEHWRHGAIAMGPDTVAFQISDDGTTWRTGRALPRPASMAGAPKLLIAGKGHFDAESGLTAEALDNDSKNPGAMSEATIRDITVQAVSADGLKESTDQEDYQDVPGLAQLALPGDPTFDSVASVYPPMQYVRDALGVADHPQEFGVGPDGVIGCTPSYRANPKAGNPQRCWITVGGDKARFGRLTTVTRSLDEGWLPVLTCGWTQDGVVYKQTAAAWSEGMSPDTSASLLLKITGFNEAKEPRPVRFGLHSERENKELLGWDGKPLPPGETDTVWMELAFPDDGGALSVKKIEPADYDSRLAEVKSAWRKLVEEQGMKIDVPEARVMNAWRAWLVWMFTDVDKVNGFYEYHDGGAGFYELVYGFSAARAAVLADHLNRSGEARKWTEAMLNMGDKDGLHLVNFGLPDQGTLLSAAAHNYRVTRDVEWLRKHAPTLVKMCQWARNARAKAKAEQGPNHPCYGMIKLRPYCDHPEPAYYLISDVLLVKGMKDVAGTLADVGMKQDSEWIAKEAEEYEVDVKRAMEKSVFTERGQELLPLFTETRELLRATDWKACDYYGLCVPPLLEHGGNIIPVGSRYADLIVNALEKRGGLLMGVAKFWGGIDHAYSAGYWYDRMTRGEPEKAILGLYSSMAYGMSRDTFSSVEVTFIKEGKNFPTLPHNYSNLEQLRLVRNMLVTEVGDKLMIGGAIPRPWLAAGKHVAFDDAMTTFGIVSARYETAADGAKITAKLKMPQMPAEAKMEVVVRHPEEKTLSGAKVEGATVFARGRDSVTLNKVGALVTVECEYAR